MKGSNTWLIVLGFKKLIKKYKKTSDKQNKTKQNSKMTYIYILLQALSPTNMKGGWEVLVDTQGK